MTQLLRNTRGPIMRRHPLTGAPIEPVGVVGGRVVWPILGGAPEGGDGSGGSGSGGDGGQGGTGSGAGGDGGSQGGSGSGGSGGDGGQGGTGSGAGGDGDLGFPKDTPVAEMTDRQAAAYWRHMFKGRDASWKDLAGDRPVADVRKDLEELAQIRKERMTPSEKAIADAEDRGRKAATAEALQKAARSIADVQLRAGLRATGVKDADLDNEVAAILKPLNLDAFIVDGDINTGELSAYVRRLAPAAGSGGDGDGRGRGRRTRDFGGGRSGEGGRQAGSRGTAEADRRFGTKENSTAR